MRGGMLFNIELLLMREVTYVDADGRKFVRLIPQDAPDTHAQYGVNVGPPSLAPLNLPKELEVRLNNQLYDRRILTAKDALRGKDQIFAALQAAFRVDIATISNLYGE